MKVALWVLLLTAWVWAQPFLLEPESSSEFKTGKSTFVEAVVAPDGSTVFALHDLNSMAPVNVTLISQSGELSLVAYDSDPDKPLQTRKTGPEGVAEMGFRTGRNTLIDVRGPVDSRFQLLVWVGPELEFAPPAPTATPLPPEKENLPASAPALTPTWSWTTLLLGLNLLVLLGIFFRMGRRGTVAVWLLFLPLALPRPVASQPPRNPDQAGEHPALPARPPLIRGECVPLCPKDVRIRASAVSPSECRPLNVGAKPSKKPTISPRKSTLSTTPSELPIQAGC